MKYLVLDLTKPDDRNAAMFWAVKKGRKTTMAMQARIAEIEAQNNIGIAPQSQNTSWAVSLRSPTQT